MSKYFARASLSAGGFLLLWMALSANWITGDTSNDAAAGILIISGIISLAIVLVLNGL